MTTAGWIVYLLLWALLILVVFVIPATLGYRLGLRRQHEVMGLVLGLVLSWVGVLIVALLPRPGANRALS